MYISSVQIESYKSYRSSATLKLMPGINIVTGRNNVGKTALLEALGMSISNRPHRTSTTAPKATTIPLPESTLNVRISLDQGELSHMLFPQGQSIQINVPVPQKGHNFPGFNGIPDADFPQNLLRWNIEREFHNIEATVTSRGIVATDVDRHYPAQRDENDKIRFIELTITREETVHSALSVARTKTADYGGVLADNFQKNTYLFRANRPTPGICPIGPGHILKPNTENLAEVIQNLQSNHTSRELYNSVVRRVFPQIKQVSARHVEGKMAEVILWNETPIHRRGDLAISLDDSGTGVGQALALLYVVLNSEHPRVILIDEPQSFLHPGAVRKLIEIFTEHPEHQYILATHSPTVISASNPATVTLIRQQDGVSDFCSIDPRENDHLRQVLAEIGASLSDVFGADNILWVEGPTEELCFPIILNKVAKRALMGTAIVSVKQTGDFDGKDAQKSFDIYKQISQGKGLLPPTLGFIFDREQRSERARENLQMMSNVMVKFTKRRLYENYLLNPRAIEAVVNATQGFRDTPVTVTEIEDFIAAEVRQWRDDRSPAHIKRHGQPPTDPAAPFIDTIHGARLLEHMFTTLSKTKVTYQKTIHSVDLTRWLAENAPNDLADVADLITDVLDSPQARRAQSSP